MLDHRIANQTIIAVIVAATAALIFRSWLQVSLLAGGFSPGLVADLSYLIVPPIMLLLLLPLWRPEKRYLIAQFRRADLTRSLALRALAIGLLLRLLWWSTAVAGTSFGVYATAVADPIVGPTIGIDCPVPSIMLLGFIVTAVLMPVVEELVFRSYLLGFLRRRGPLLAILISALLFAIFHRSASWPFVMFTGTIFGLLYWVTGSLWSSLIAHSTFNGLILLDWRCLSVQWNPTAAEIPALIPGLSALALLAIGSGAMVMLLHKETTEAKKRPGNRPLESVCNTLNNV